MRGEEGEGRAEGAEWAEGNGKTEEETQTETEAESFWLLAAGRWPLASASGAAIHPEDESGHPGQACCHTKPDRVLSGREST